MFSSLLVFDVGILYQAYAWGFDIRSWQRHLNPLTWPEILRQFALSAGFGPKLKKRNVEETYLRDDNEVRTIRFFSPFLKILLCCIILMLFRPACSLVLCLFDWFVQQCLMVLIPIKFSLRNVLIIPFNLVDGFAG